MVLSFCPLVTKMSGGFPLNLSVGGGGGGWGLVTLWDIPFAWLCRCDLFWKVHWVDPNMSCHGDIRSRRYENKLSRKVVTVLKGLSAIAWLKTKSWRNREIPWADQQGGCRESEPSPHPLGWSLSVCFSNLFTYAIPYQCTSLLILDKFSIRPRILGKTKQTVSQQTRNWCLVV